MAYSKGMSSQCHGGRELSIGHRQPLGLYEHFIMKVMWIGLSHGEDWPENRLSSILLLEISPKSAKVAKFGQLRFQSQFYALTSRVTSKHPLYTEGMSR